MLKKLLKYTLRTLGLILLIPIAAGFMLYIPRVQEVVRAQVEKRVGAMLGMELSIGRISLAFPIRLAVSETLVREQGDTLLKCRLFALDIDPIPLLRGEIAAGKIQIEDAALNYRDSAAGFAVRGSIGCLTLRDGRIGIDSRELRIRECDLGTCRIALSSGSSSAPEKPDTPSDPAAWKIAVGRIAVCSTDVAMRLEPGPTEINLHLARAEVEKGRFDMEHPEISVERIELSDNRILYGYGASGPRRPEKTAPTAIGIEGLGLTADSIRMLGSRIALRIVRMQFAEQSGFAVNDLCGAFEMGPDTIRIAGLRIETPQSELRAEAEAGATLLRLDPAAPIAAAISADLGIEELARLAPGLAHPALQGLQGLQGLRMRLAFHAAGRLADIDPIDLKISSPGHLRFAASGSAKNIPDMARADVDIRFDGALRQLGFLEALLPDTALRRRIELPARVGLDGRAKLCRGTWSLLSAWQIDGGSLRIEAAANPATEQFRAEATVDSLPLGEILPHDSIGTASLRIGLQGRGFDPLSARTSARIETSVGQFAFRGHDFGGLTLEAALEQGTLSGRIADRDPALRMDLELDGSLSRERQQVAIRGSVEGFDLAELGMTPDSIGGSFAVEALACRTAADSLAVRLDFDRIYLYGPEGESPIRPTGASFSTAPSGTRASFRSGDLDLAFLSPRPIDAIASAVSRASDTLRRQIAARGLDMELLQPLLPEFSLHGRAGEENIVNNFLRTKQLSFERLAIDAGNGPGQPLAFDLCVNGISAPGVALDTLAAGFLRNGKGLDASLRVTDRQGPSDSLARTSLEARVALRTARILLRRDAPGEVPVRFGAQAQWNEEGLSVSVLPDLGSWQVNPGNFVSYGPYGTNPADRSIRANLDISRGTQRLALHNVELPGMPHALRLDIAGIDIERSLRLIPQAPPVGGRLGAGITFGMSPDSLCLNAALAVDSLCFYNEPFGNISIRADYARGHGHNANVHFSIDDREVLAVEGAYRIGEPQPLDIDGSVNGFQLERLNAFMPQQTVRLAGTLAADIHIAGAPDNPRFDGNIRLAQTLIRVPMIGTSFRIPADTVRLAGNRADFGNFNILPPNNNPLTISGNVDFGNLRRPLANLRVHTRNFQFLNVARRERTTVYGSGFLDLDASAHGPLDELSVRGNAALLRGTEINYVMQESTSQIEQQSQDVVAFVPFDETDAAEPETTAQPANIRIGGLDLLLNVDISEQVALAVDLSPDGTNRIDLRGGGNLSYAMNPLGDIALSGKYALSGGTVRYNPPVISQKVFAIRPGSYVEWTGQIADPSFDITAVETVRANVSSDNDQSRTVNFEISVNIRNSLDNLDVSFGLAAPEDLAMQNQLQSLTDQQRAMQAMNLLIYNTYTGPGTTARVNSENPLNAFVQKELNQWAQNSLKGVDLSFGIDSYGQTDPNGARTDYSYRLSKKLFGNRVSVSIGGKFSTGTDPAENLRENMIDDIALEYLLTNRGNMLVRIFRHTGYESILEGEITETGVGFIIRKKMSRLGELFRSQRPQDRKAKNNENDAH